MHAVYEALWKKKSKAGKNTGDFMALEHFTLGTSG